MLNYNVLNSNKWAISEDKYNSDNLGKTESIFHLGNGCLGLRSSNEEKSAMKTRNMFLNGVFNKVDADEVSELANIPDVLETQIKINGNNLRVNESTVSNYCKKLDMYTGTLTRSMTVINDDIVIELMFTRFVMLDKNVICQKCSIIVNKDVDLEIKSGIDGQVSNSGCQHFNEGKKRMYDGVLQNIVTTNESKIDVCINTKINFNCKVDDLILMDRRMILKRFSIKAKKNMKIEFEKISQISSSFEYSTKISTNSLKQFNKLDNFEVLHLKNKQLWKTHWMDKDINIKGYDYSQVAIRFSLFQLRCNTDYIDERTNIGAKGLTGEGYKGHAFWDTEIFILPYYIYSDPAVAKKLIKYRYLGLTGARKKAKENNYEGAMYPWEAASPELGEVTPIWGAADIITGKSIRIESGFIEQHITSDVIYGLWLYYNISGDQKFMDQFGYEMILDTAKFWASRVEKTNRGYEIKDVIGPDEYKEHRNNNSFTNYMAKFNMDLAVKYVKEHNIDHLVQKLNVDIEKIRDVCENIVLHEVREDLILAQDDTFLDLKKIDLSKYKNQTNVGTIFEDYNLEQINEIQVCKQADVLILFLLLEDLFTKEEKNENFKYYESITLHDSSLSLSTHCILANDLQKYDLALELFKRCLDIDLGNNMKTSDHGIHTASLGGMWQCVIYGFAGIRYTKKGLRIEPKLPKDFEELKFSIYYLENKLVINVKIDSLDIQNLGNSEVEILNRENVYIIKPNQRVSII